MTAPFYGKEGGTAGKHAKYRQWHMSKRKGRMGTVFLISGPKLLSLAHLELIVMLYS